MMGNQKKQFIRNNWKWLIGILLSFFAVVIPSWISMSQNQSKSVDVSVSNVTPIVEKQAGGIEDIVVTVSGVPIDKPYLSIIKIANSGGLPVTREDYEKPLEISVGENVQIIKAIVSETIPKGISANITWERNKFFFHPALLNPEDTVIVNVLTGSATPVFDATGRISGIKNISIKEKSDKPFKMVMGGMLSIFALICLTAALIVFNFSKGNVILNKRSSWFVSFTLFGAYSIISMKLLELFGYTTFDWHFFLFYLASVCISMPLAYIINKSAQPSPQPDCVISGGADAGSSGGAAG